MLERFGYRVLMAGSGEESVRLLEEARDEVAAVLLDVTMPGMHGLETLRRLKTVRPDVPVVLSSGYTDIEAMRRFQGQDLAGFIQKPYSAMRLAEKLDEILRPR
jgi:CheY-like chemotaxis protein